MRCGDLHLWVQDIPETSVRFDVDTNNPNLQKILASRNTQRREEQVILSTILCQENESLPQAGNDQTTNLQEHACKEKWDGLWYSNKVSNNSHQHVRGKRTHHEQ